MPPAEALDDSGRLLLAFVEVRGRRHEDASGHAAAYDELHAAGHLTQRASFYRWFLSLLRPRAGRRLLDVSCGQGGLLRAATGAGLSVVGLDLSARAAAAAAQQAPGAQVMVADAERLPFPSGSFDYVTSIGSVEHYLHPQRAIREMARVLDRDGTALLLVPNTFGLLGNVLRVWRTSDVFDDGQPLQRYGTLVQWRRLLELNGLTVLSVTRYEREWPNTWKDVRWYLARPHKLVRALVAPLIPLSLASFLVFRCRRT